MTDAPARACEWCGQSINSDERLAILRIEGCDHVAVAHVVLHASCVEAFTEFMELGLGPADLRWSGLGEW